MRQTSYMSKQAPSRRTSNEVRALVLDAARDLFSRQGYDATTMRAVSAQAGVSFPLLFKNFESKEGLFNAAVADPFAELLEQYEKDWEELAALGGSEHDLVSRFVRRFYELARDNRALLLSCAARRATGGEGPELDVVDQFSTIVQRCLQPILRKNYTWKEDPAITVAACIGSILGIALLDDLLFPPNTRRPGVNRVVGETVNVILYGLRPPPNDAT